VSCRRVAFKPSRLVSTEQLFGFAQHHPEILERNTPPGVHVGEHGKLNAQLPIRLLIGDNEKFAVLALDDDDAFIVLDWRCKVDKALISFDLKRL
jgi:hypothetical protein